MTSATTEAELVQLEALGPTGAYRGHSPETITDVAGNDVAELTLVPRPYIARALAKLRNATPLPPTARAVALERAGEMFATAEICGQTPDAYHFLVSRVSGLGISVVRDTTCQLAQMAANAPWIADQARPRGAATDRADPLAAAGAGLWVRRGEVFAVHAAGNHPGVHGEWLQALALGYRVAIRPSRREPFTAHRLIRSLLLAGFKTDHIALLPTDHEAADELLDGADLAMVYGGDDVVRRYSSRTNVRPQGPGRAKILITADTNPLEHIDVLVESISGGGGTACTNTTAVLVEGDPRPLAEAVAERLSALPSLPPEHPDALLPVQRADAAYALQHYLGHIAQGTGPVLGHDQVVEPLGDGSAALRPAVHIAPAATSPQLSAELPFPCVWIAPWKRADGITCLRGTLSLSILSEDQQLVEDALRDPSIRSVHLGRSTQFSTNRMPHDDYLAAFLMTTKGVVA